MIYKFGQSLQGSLPTIYTTERPYSCISSHSRRWRRGSGYEQNINNHQSHYHQYPLSIYHQVFICQPFSLDIQKYKDIYVSISIFHKYMQNTCFTNTRIEILNVYNIYIYIWKHMNTCINIEKIYMQKICDTSVPSLSYRKQEYQRS